MTQPKPGAFEADQLQARRNNINKHSYKRCSSTQGNGNSGVNVTDVTINDNEIKALKPNANLQLSGSGTGAVTIDSEKLVELQSNPDDSTSKVTVAEALDVTGALKLNTSLALATGATVTGILDEDNMATNAATQLATPTTKAYADTTRY